MPLFQPSNITPSSFAGVGGGTIDATDNVSITWQVNGNEPMTAFKIDIYQTQNNAQVQVGTSEIQPISDFYPTDNKGNPNYYTFEPNVTWSSLAVSGQSIANGNEYTIQITQYWGNQTDANHTIAQISQSAFIAREKPTLTITGLPSTAVQSVSLPITATFIQANGDSAEWVRWQFYQTDENGKNAVLLDDTGVVNTQVFSYTLDNMFNGNNYKIVCTAQSKNGVQVTAEQKFAVAYELPNIIGQFSVDCSDKMSNLLSWKDIAVEVGDDIEGAPSGSYSFNNGNLVLPENSSVLWDKVADGKTQAESQLNIGTPWTLAWKGYSSNFNYPQQNNTIEINTFYKIINSELISTSPQFPNSLKKIVNRAGTYKYYACDETNIYLIDISTKPISYTTLYTLVGAELYGASIKDIDISPSGRRLVVVGTHLEIPLADGGGESGDLLFNIASNNFKYISSATDDSTAPLLSVKFLNDYLYAFAYHFSDSAIVLALKREGKDVVDYTYVIEEKNAYANTYVNLSINGGAKTGHSGGLLSINYNLLLSNRCTILSYSDDETNGSLSLLLDNSKFSNGRGSSGLFSPTSNIFVTGSYVYKITSANSIQYIGKIANASSPIAFDRNGKILISKPSSSSLNHYIQTCIYNDKIEQVETVVFGDYSNVPVDLWGEMAVTFNSDKEIKTFNYNIACPFSISKTSLGDIYQATLESLINEDGYTIADYDFSYTDAGYSISGQTETPQTITANITLSLYPTATATYFQINEWLTVLQNGRKLQLQINGENVGDGFEIPPNIGTVVFSINQNTFAVYFGNSNANTQAISESQPNITSIKLLGKQTANWIVVENGTKDIQSNYNPIWSIESGTKFLTNFDLNSLKAGELGAAEPNLEIYRENLQTSEVQKISKNDLTISQMRDYSWITGEQYKYTAYALLGNVYTGVQTFIPYPICKRQNFYLLLETLQDEKQLNVYHVVNSWRFGANISAGSVSNNNQPNFLTNFTPYRTKQPTTRNSESGTLTALLSNVQNGKYADTVEQMKALKAISNSLNTFFLKDMKGNLYMVSISNAITQTINTKSSVQEVTVSIPWEETGSADGISIIQTPEDNGWVGSNDVENVRLAVKLNGDNITQELGLPEGVTIEFVDGHLYVNYPDGYTGTTFSLDENGNLVATTPEEQEQPSLYLDKGTVKLTETVLPVQNVRNNYKFTELQKLADAVGAKVEVKFILPNGEEI